MLALVICWFTLVVEITFGGFMSRENTKPVTHEEVASVESLYVVGGEPGTASWPEPTVANQLAVDLNGISDPAGDRHTDEFRKLRGYQVQGGWAGREIRNDRQISIALASDLERAASDLKIADKIPEVTGLTVGQYMARLLAINIVLKGELIDEDQLRRYLGPGSFLMFGNPVEGAILRVTEALLPCAKPRTMAKNDFDVQGTKDEIKGWFQDATWENRGYSSSVMSSGLIAVGASVAVQLPADHRTSIPGWNHEMLSSHYAEMGIRDPSALRQIFGISSEKLEQKVALWGSLAIGIASKNGDQDDDIVQAINAVLKACSQDPSAATFDISIEGETEALTGLAEERGDLGSLLLEKSFSMLPIEDEERGNCRIDFSLRVSDTLMVLGAIKRDFGPGVADEVLDLSTTLELRVDFADATKEQSS